ncbi:hypothetical protein SFUMM280S_07511 [Streptomyces fumanus]
MARWLRSPASDAYLARQREEYAAKRAEVGGRLTDGLGYPEGAFFPGRSGPFRRRAHLRGTRRTRPPVRGRTSGGTACTAAVSSSARATCPPPACR